jgi:Prolyl oligopeptidase family/Dipeptidyl peptidase IV (DPP IV) N-terminal region
MQTARQHVILFAILISIGLSLPLSAHAQGTQADYERANALKTRYESAAIDIAGPATWIGNTHRFWYRRLSKGVCEYFVFDADTLQKQTAFDHAKIAAALSKLLGTALKAADLQLGALRFDNTATSFFATVDGASVRCTVPESACTKVDSPLRGPRSQGPVVSPNGKWEASINNYNLLVRAVGSRDLVMLSTDGSEGNYYDARSIAWAPDSTRLAAYRVRPGYKREVHYIESSPEDQIQPKFSSIVYAKPGDVLDLEQPVLFDVVGKKQLNVDNALFPNPYELSDPVWRKDGRAFTLEYNQRGHQIYRIIEVDGVSGKPRALISDEPKTFFSYRPANGSLADSGRKYRHDLNDGKEIIWMSERDGWSHLYLYDGVTGTIKNQITKGEWVVRGVQLVDDVKRQIWFSAGGMYPGKDPYFAYYYRINFDGSGLTQLTTADANHNGAYSTDGQLFVDNYSRVDSPPVLELRKAEDNSVLSTIEHGDISELTKTGWRAPEVFTAKGRDGKTDIWGIIIRPTNFDPSKRYPVIENIYAGPQGSFVPKSFLSYSSMMAQADIGFIVVQIDGMGTSNRSKAFHDVAWRNLGDAGFPDRILWHKAVVAKYAWYDITRVGIYGGSAGGQNSLGGLLFHPEFYKAAVSYAGCHDNRMDKIWWNEQWMGWPIGPQYSASSNVDNAYRLQGDLLLVVGELDTNVDPSSTMQVVHQLLKHDKNFDLLVVPGANHPAARGDQYTAYGDHKRYDFFVRHLLGVMPPPWNQAGADSSLSAR